MYIIYKYMCILIKTCIYILYILYVNAKKNNMVKISVSQLTRLSVKKEPPPYGHRKSWVPRSLDDFGDGGAFPEIHVAQYPLNMGNKKATVSFGPHFSIYLLTFVFMIALLVTCTCQVYYEM